jgi:hypothetical protein
MRGGLRVHAIPAPIPDAVNELRARLVAKKANVGVHGVLTLKPTPLADVWNLERTWIAVE